VDTWVSQTIRGDLYVEPVGHRLNASTTVLPPDLLERIAAIPGVAAMDTYRSTRFLYRGRIAFTVGIDFAVQRDRGHLTFLEGDTKAVFDRALRNGEVIVTESFAHHHHVAAGDSIDLDTTSGRSRRRIAGVFLDYSVEAGAVLMDRRLYAQLWQDDRTESFALYLKPGADAAAVREAVVAASADRVLLHVMPNQELRARVLTVFDQTFQITWALQAIAVLVSVLGVIGALTALILQRGREIAVLRAGGALRRQIRTMVLAESALLGLIGGVMGCVIGLALAMLLVHVINRQFFGWTLQTVIEPGVFVQAVVLMMGTALLAGFWPARFAASRSPVEAMRTE
jgi:putative ABC transport system permease protein